MIKVKYHSVIKPELFQVCVISVQGGLNLPVELYISVKTKNVQKDRCHSSKVIPKKMKTAFLVMLDFGPQVRTKLYARKQFVQLINSRVKYQQ